MKDGGPAFPLAASTGDPRDGTYCQNGMSLRDWFAGQALAGMMGSHALPDHPQYWDWLSGVAVTPYRIADKMLAEREKEETHE
jgi:hypothetical protein